MNLLRQHRISAFLLVLLAMAAFATSQKDLVLLMSSGAIAVLSWYVTEGPRGRSLPEVASNILILGLLMWTLAEFLTDIELADATSVLGRFLFWLLVIKLFSRRTAYESGLRCSGDCSRALMQRALRAKVTERFSRHHLRSLSVDDCFRSFAASRSYRSS